MNWEECVKAVSYEIRQFQPQEHDVDRLAVRIILICAEYYGRLAKEKKKRNEL